MDTITLVMMDIMNRILSTVILLVKNMMYPMEKLQNMVLTIQNRQVTICIPYSTIVIPIHDHFTTVRESTAGGTVIMKEFIHPVGTGSTTDLTTTSGMMIVALML